MKYRNRPRIVDAEQWQLGVQVKDVFELGELGVGMFYSDRACGELVRPGDWIVTEDGRRRVVDGALFEAMYEKVEE